MTTNWEGALKSITDHSQALGVVILDGSTRYAWCQTELILPLAKSEVLLKELPTGTDTFRAARLGSHRCLLYLISQPNGSRCAFIYPLTTHLAAAKTDAQAFLTAAHLVPPVSLDSLKARDLAAYKHTPENATWQAEFLALYSDAGQTDQSVILPEQDDMATRPVSLFTESTRPVSLFTESTRPIQLHLPGALEEVAEEAYWVKIV